jgi:hypothetical protein
MRPVPRSSWTLGVAILIILALLIGALALAINAQTGWRFGTTPLAALTFASLSVAVDGLAIALPAAAIALWHADRRVLALAAWIVCGAAVVGATLASLGFAQLHFGDTAAGRAAIVASMNAVADRRATGIATAERAEHEKPNVRSGAGVAGTAKRTSARPSPRSPTPSQRRFRPSRPLPPTLTRR